MRFPFRRLGRRAALLTAALLSTVALAGLAGLAACSSASGADAGGSSSPAGAAPIAVVTSTNVWGDVVEQIGGDAVSVTAVISDPSADPHSYEANAQTQLALAKARLVVENGGGYDDFMLAMKSSSAGADGTVLNAVEISGKSATDGELNEHVWYDFPTVDKVAAQIATELSAIDPANADTFAANAAIFSGKIADLTAKVAAIKAAHAGAAIAITEPVPLYLTEAAGLVNKTPAEFSEAIEAGTDVPPTVLSDTLALFSGKQVAALVYNEQTASPETEQLLAAAKDNSIAVVGVTETLPADEDYVSWMDSNIAALAAAVGG